MSTSDELYVMKNRLDSYNANVRLFEAEQMKYEKILYEMNGVSAVAWDKVGRQESLSNFSRVIAMMPKKDKQWQRLMDVYRDIQICDELMSRMEADDRRLVVEYYIDRIPQKTLAENRGKTQKQIEREINRIIRNAL